MDLLQTTSSYTYEHTSELFVELLKNTSVQASVLEKVTVGSGPNYSEKLQEVQLPSG